MPIVDSGRCDGFAESGYSEINGTREYNVAVTLRIHGQRSSKTIEDKWEAGDQRPAGSPRWDRTLTGQKLTKLLEVNVIIDPNKGDAKGTAFDAFGPIHGVLVSMQHQSPYFQDSQINPEGLPSFWYIGTDEDGKTLFPNILVGQVSFTAEWYDMGAIQSAQGEIPFDAQLVVDFEF